VSGGGVGAEGMEVNSVAECHLETNTKYLSIIFAITSIVFSLKHCGTRLLWIPVQSLIESPGTVVSTSFQDFTAQQDCPSEDKHGSVPMSTEPEAGTWFAKMNSEERSRAADACLLLPERSYASLTKKVPRRNAATEAPKELRTRSRGTGGTADATVVADDPATYSHVTAPLLLSKGDGPARVRRTQTAVSVRLTRSADSSPLARRSRPPSTSPLSRKPQGDTVSPTRPSFPQSVHARWEARKGEAQGILDFQREAGKASLQQRVVSVDACSRLVKRSEPFQCIFPVCQPASADKHGERYQAVMGQPVTRISYRQMRSNERSSSAERQDDDHQHGSIEPRRLRAQSEESTEPRYTWETACPMLDHAPLSSSRTGAPKRFTRDSNNLRNMMSKFEAQTIDMQKQLNVYKSTTTSSADSEDRVLQPAPQPTSCTALTFSLSPSSHAGEAQTAAVDMQKKLNVYKSNSMSPADSEDRVFQPAPPPISRTASTFSRSTSSHAEMFSRAISGTWAQAHFKRTPSDSGDDCKRTGSAAGFSRTLSRESFMHTPSHSSFTRMPSDAGPTSPPLTSAPLRALSSSANYNNYCSLPLSRLHSLKMETEPEAAPKGGGAGVDWGVNVITFCKDAAKEGDEADDTDDDDGPYEDEEGERESGSQDFNKLEQQGANQLCGWAAAFEHPREALLKEEMEDEECLNTINIDQAGSEIPESCGFSPIAACTSTSGFSSTSSPSLEEDVDMTGQFAALVQMEQARKSKKYYWEEEDYISQEEQDCEDQMNDDDTSSRSEEFGLKGPEILRMFGLEVPEIEEKERTITVEASALQPLLFRRTASNGGGGRSEKPSPPAPHSPAPHTFLRRTASGGPGDTFIHTVTVHYVNGALAMNFVIFLKRQNS